MKNTSFIQHVLIAAAVAAACSGPQKQEVRDGQGDKVQLITVAPGHFHAALVQKSMYPNVDSVVHVYAPEGAELDAYNALISQYNTAAENPTHWKEMVYKGPDFLSKMLQEKKGNVVVLAGNNRDKIHYIGRAIDSGLNVLADKPMVINTEGFAALEKAFAKAAEKKVLLYDIMTERYEINSILQREFSMDSAFFGGLITGSPEQPAVTKESVHHFYKEVSGNPLIRPAWFYDVTQEGEGMVDVTTHLIDLVQWEAYPEQALDYKKDVVLLSSKRWATLLSPQQFETSTKATVVPDYLKKDLDEKGNLVVYSNGEINYKLKNTYVKVSVIWNFEAPKGAGDLHYSIMRGHKANLIIKQGEEQGYVPVFYVEPANKGLAAGFEARVKTIVEKLASKYAGLSYSREGDGSYKITVDPSLVTVHEQHFAQVTEKYLSFLKNGDMPAWEVPNMLAKYYLTTQALKQAKTVK